MKAFIGIFLVAAIVGGNLSFGYQTGPCVVQTNWRLCDWREFTFRLDWHRCVVQSNYATAQDCTFLVHDVSKCGPNTGHFSVTKDDGNPNLCKVSAQSYPDIYDIFRLA